MTTKKTPVKGLFSFLFNHDACNIGEKFTSFRVPLASFS